MTADSQVDQRFMRLAASLGARGLGFVGTNPLVGCVIVGQAGSVVGRGWHAQFGGPHAEINALTSCTLAGHDPRGATLYCTLEPCNHSGKTPPCSQAVIDAGIARCVIARPDPTAQAAGGADALQAAGTQVDFIDCPPASRLTDSFVKREQTGLPWVIAKWASSVDGRIALPTGESQWISNAQSRQAVHRLRARMDAILTGIGTVLADDPMLTARGVLNHRTPAQRIVVDPHLLITPDAKLIQSAQKVPTIVAALPEHVDRQRHHAQLLEKSGAAIVPLELDGKGEVDYRSLLRTLVRKFGTTRLLVEAGGGLVGRLLQAELVDELMVYIAPKLFGGAPRYSPTRALEISRMEDAPKLVQRRLRQIGEDIELNYRVERRQ